MPRDLVDQVAKLQQFQRPGPQQPLHFHAELSVRVHCLQLMAAVSTGGKPPAKSVPHCPPSSDSPRTDPDRFAGRRPAIVRLVVVSDLIMRSRGRAPADFGGKGERCGGAVLPRPDPDLVEILADPAPWDDPTVADAVAASVIDQAAVVTCLVVLPVGTTAEETGTPFGARSQAPDIAFTCIPLQRRGALVALILE
ncbi:hypothetical protein [Streptomyces sp. XY332]|uniref:hypothetical protein n=1 Tax=Streptomyces sp. XY332 TaxID=1415561 RepID=UPI0006B182A1|nr:hypothetical protein [Streptomyces sp. XY332]KOY50190.1 hypothetical protein ADK59_38195 [Streptomyces sp. XY332]